MIRFPFESATLLTPGRSSYVDEQGLLQLTPASKLRADIAACIFDSDIHEKALFSGGYPGLSQNWDDSLTPPADIREAHLIALPLLNRLKGEGLSRDEIDDVVLTQSDTSNTFSDIIRCVELGLIDCDKFNTDFQIGIHLVAGALHGRRIGRILGRILDIDHSRILRYPMNDIYGTPNYPHQRRDSWQKAIAKELAANVVTDFVLRDVVSGNMESFKEAEQRFVAIAKI